MKTLGFRPNLVSLIIAGEKTATWRLWDDKDLLAGDEIDLIDSSTGAVFARAVITKIIEKPFAALTEADKIGHETYQSGEEMYQTFAEYYDRPVGPGTVVKVARFELRNTHG